MRTSYSLRAAFFSLALTLAVSAPVRAQTILPFPEENDLAGPRVGFTVLSDGVLQTLSDNSLEVGGVVSQFGWQFEKRFFSRGNGITAVTEWVVLLGGLEQGVAIPSISWMVGLRNSRGVEFGIGPNLSPLGSALAIAGGMTFRHGALSIPVNLAVVPSKAGVRVSVLSGFAIRR